MCGFYLAYSINSSYLLDHEEDFVLCEEEEFDGLNKNLVFNSVPHKDMKYYSKSQL